MIWAVLWEMLLVLAAFSLTGRWLAALAAALAADSLIGLALTWGGWNHPLAYAPLAALLAWPAWRAARQGWNWGDWQVWALPMAMLMLALRPIGEVDSLFNLHYVLGWLENRTTPLEYAFNYPCFWEAGFLPLLTLGRSDLVLWIRPAHALLVSALGVWQVGEELGVDRRLRGAMLVCSLAFMHFWWGQSGVATLKNDLLVSAGQVLGALVLLRVSNGRATNRDAWLAGLAALFVSTKASGPFVVAAAALCWLVWRRRVDWGWAVPMAALWMAGVGFTFAGNWWRYGNPFYPFTMKLGPVVFAGRADQSATSIWANIGNERLWRLFLLPDGGVSPAGLLFPLFLAAIPFVLWRVNKALFGYCAVLGLLYVNGIYSAGGAPGSLRFLEADLSTLRYMGGALALGEMAAASVLGRWGWLFAGVQGVSRLSLLAGRESSGIVMEAAVVALVLLLAGWLLRRWPLAVACLVVAAGCWQVERKRAGWLPEVAEVWRVTYDAPAATIALLVDDSYSPQPCAHWWLKGRGLRHDVRIGEVDGARYVVWPRWPEGSAPKWSNPEYRIRAEAQGAVMWERAID